MKHIAKIDLDTAVSYLHAAVSIASGVFLLPIILTNLDVLELGVYYFVLTANSLVVLVDFGVSVNFMRAASYAYKGATLAEIVSKSFSNEGRDASGKPTFYSIVRYGEGFYFNLSILVFILALIVYFGFAVNESSLGQYRDVELRITFLFASVFASTRCATLFYNGILVSCGLFKWQRALDIATGLFGVVLAVIFTLVYANPLSVILSVEGSVVLGLVCKVLRVKSLYPGKSVCALKRSERASLRGLIIRNSAKQGMYSLSVKAVVPFILVLSGIRYGVAETTNLLFANRLNEIMLNISRAPALAKIHELCHLRALNNQVKIVQISQNVIGLSFGSYLLLFLVGLFFGSFVFDLIGTQVEFPILFLYVSFGIYGIVERITTLNYLVFQTKNQIVGHLYGAVYALSVGVIFMFFVVFGVNPESMIVMVAFAMFSIMGLHSVLLNCKELSVAPIGYLKVVIVMFVFWLIFVLVKIILIRGI